MKVKRYVLSSPEVFALFLREFHSVLYYQICNNSNLLRAIQKECIGNNRNHVGVIGVAESVHIGVVAQWVIGNQRSLSVAGSIAKIDYRQRNEEGKALESSS